MKNVTLFCCYTDIKQIELLSTVWNYIPNFLFKTIDLQTSCDISLGSNEFKNLVNCTSSLALRGFNYKKEAEENVSILPIC